jgi:chorismate dehydratase
MAELGGRRIAVTGETSTSVRLMRILLAFRDEVPAPVLVGLDEPSDAALIIGDAALRLLQGPWPRRFCYDLGEEWTRWTGYPMVFAAWAVRLDTAPAARETLETTLGDALEIGLASLPAIAARRRDLGLSEAEITAYLESFRYRIGPDDEKAVAEYRRLLALLDG